MAPHGTLLLVRGWDLHSTLTKSVFKFIEYVIKEHEREEKKEGVLKGRLLFSFLLFCLFSHGIFLVVILVQIWLCVLCFEDSITFESLKFLNIL